MFGLLQAVLFTVSDVIRYERYSSLFLRSHTFVFMFISFTVFMCTIKMTLMLFKFYTKKKTHTHIQNQPQQSIQRKDVQHSLIVYSPYSFKFSTTFTQCNIHVLMGEKKIQREKEEFHVFVLLLVNQLELNTKSATQ